MMVPSSLTGGLRCAPTAGYSPRSLRDQEHRRLRIAMFALFAWFITTTTWYAPCTFAQAVPSKEPSSTHIFPAGGRRGTTVPVRIGTEAMPPKANLRVWGDSVRAPEQVGDRVHVKYEPSPRRQPRDADGVGAAMSYPTEWASEFAIDADAPPSVAMWRLTCGWGGTQPRPFVIGDLPEFIETESNSTVEHAERIVLPVTVNGQIAGERDLDCFVFAAKAGQTVVADVLAARIGSPLDPVVELVAADGRRLAGGRSRVAGDSGRIRIAGDSVLTFDIPVDGDYVLQVSNVSFRGGAEFVYRITLSDRLSEWYEIPFGPTFVFDNNTAATAVNLISSGLVCGFFDTAKAEGWYRFTTKRDELLAIHCKPATLASPALPIIAIEDAAGKLLAKASSAESAERECYLEWRAPADGEYRMRVRDLQFGVRGGPEFGYWLVVTPATPDFALTVAADYANVTQGNRSEIDLTAKRFGGFNGPIELNVAGLPEGVTFEPPRIAENQTLLKLTFKAVDDTRPTDARLRITGTANIEGNAVVHAARVPHLGDAIGGGLAESFAENVHLTVQHKPIVHLTCSEAYQYAHRGTVYPYAMRLERLNGFEGNVHIQRCERQVQDLDGIDIVETIVRAGTSEFPNLIYFPESMHASEQHHCRPYAQAWATFTDKWGQQQSMLAIADKRCMVRTLPSLVQLKAIDDRVTAQPGETVRCRLMLERTPNFTGPMDIDLIEPTAATGFFADPVRISAGETEAEIAVRIGTPLAAESVLKFRATGRLGDDVVVVSQATMPLQTKRPAESSGP
jgi:hypothetical protein